MRLQIINCVSTVVSIDGIIEYVRNANYVSKWYLSNQSSRQQGKYYNARDLPGVALVLTFFTTLFTV